MRPALFFAILAAKRYKKKHNLPDVRVLDEKHLEKFSLENKNRNYDCTTVDDKYKKGLNLERIDLPNCSSWLISKDDNPKDKVLYYIHGGGFVNGSTRDAFRFVSYATKHFGYNVYSIDYRTTPDHVCLDTISDVENGYKTLLERYKPKDIILMGESAGGNLVFALTHRLKDLGLPLPGGIISCSPVVQFLHYAYSYYECSNKTDYGITFGINAIVEYYRGELPLDHPYVSPLLGDLSNLPPTYIDASDKESLRDEARMMYVRLKEEGVDVEYHELKDFFHAMLTASHIGYVKREEYPHIIRFINKVFKKENYEK